MRGRKARHEATRAFGDSGVGVVDTFHRWRMEMLAIPGGALDTNSEGLSDDPAEVGNTVAVGPCYGFTSRVASDGSAPGIGPARDRPKLDAGRKSAACHCGVRYVQTNTPAAQSGPTDGAGAGARVYAHTSQQKP